MYDRAHLNQGSKMTNPRRKKDLANREDDTKVENHKATAKEIVKKTLMRMKIHVPDHSVW